MKRVNHIGYWYFHRFKKGGEFIDVETTENEYLNLSTKKPTLDGAVWKISFKAPKFDTPTGKLSDDEYSVIESEGDNVIIKPIGKKETSVNKNAFSDIQKGELKADFLEKLK